MSELLVSVCLITYNHENYIREAIESVLVQKTNFDWELIIADDFSTDSTRSIILEYKKKFPNKIRLLFQKKNVGPAQNSIDMYNMSNARYMALLDGDDYWKDFLKLQKQADFLENNPDYNICFHDVSILDENIGVIEDTITYKVNETTTILDLAEGNFIHTPSVMLRYNFEIPKWFLRSPIGDWTLYMLCIKDKKIKKLDGKMAVYRIHGNSNWSSKSKKERIKKTKISMKLINGKIDLPKEVSHILRMRIKASSNWTLFDKFILRIKKI